MMSVQRYRQVADMPPPERGDPKDPATYARIRELWSFSARHLPPLFAAGLYRYRTIEESDVARDAATILRMRAFREAKTAKQR